MIKNVWKVYFLLSIFVLNTPFLGYADCVECLLDKKVFKELEGNSFSPIHCATYVLEQIL